MAGLFRTIAGAPRGQRRSAAGRPAAETPTAETAKPPAAAGSAENEATALDRAEKLLHAYELTEAMIADAAGLQHCIDKLVRAYRVRGHMAADLDPLGLPRPSRPNSTPSISA